MLLPINLPQRTIMAIGIACAALCGLTLILSIWQWHHDWDLVHTTPSRTAVTLDMAATTKLITNIPNTHLFGQSLEQGYIPITNLQLSITGIVKVTDANSNDASKAYISIASQPSKIYEVGDTLLNHVKIAAILSDAVMLENSGHLEKLPLPREPLQFKAPQTEELS